MYAYANVDSNDVIGPHVLMSPLKPCAPRNIFSKFVAAKFQFVRFRLNTCAPSNMLTTLTTLVTFQASMG